MRHRKRRERRDKESVHNDEISELQQTHFHEARTHGKEHFGTSFVALPRLNSADEKCLKGS
jgi:hypothetical protein